VYATLGQVDLDAVLEGGLPPLHAERRVAHGLTLGNRGVG
jgi:hypothetical protein